MTDERDPRVAHIKYVCTACGRSTPRDDLAIKKVAFAGMGRKAKVLRSRTVAWLCPECRTSDPDWQRESFGSSPGMSGTKIDPSKGATDGS